MSESNVPRSWQVPPAEADAPGLCACGCGQKTQIATRNSTEKGWTLGVPKNYIHGHNGNKSEEQKEYDFWMRMRIRVNGCWEWTGAIHKKNGYGVTTRLQGTRQAHRVSCILLKGPIPTGLEPDHLCRNRRCINPAHLELVTRTVNARRGSKTKLTEALASKIKHSPMSNRGVAQVIGISPGAISHIRTGRTWKEVA